MDLPKIPYIKSLDTFQTIKFYNSIKTGTTLADQYLEYAKHSLVPVALEYIIGSDELGLAGRFDRLYWNIQEQEYQIWDFKTDKKIDYTSSNKLKIFDLPDCAFSKYSLQTSLYKYIIESQTNIKLGNSNIVWFDIKGNNWSIIPTTDYTELIKQKSNEEYWRTYIPS